MSSGEKIQKAYYDEGNLFGRDALFHLLKKKCPKSHPSKNEIEAWLGKQELQQLHKQTRKGGATDRFRPSKPWDNISMDLIDYSGRSAPNGKKYILVVVDNFSRFALVRPMLNKEAKTTARHLMDSCFQGRIARNPRILSSSCNAFHHRRLLRCSGG